MFVYDLFQLNFCIWGEAWIVVHFFTYTYLIVVIPFVEKTMHSPLNCLQAFVKTQLVIYVWPFFWMLSSIPLIYVSNTINTPSWLMQLHTFWSQVISVLQFCSSLSKLLGLVSKSSRLNKQLSLHCCFRVPLAWHSFPPKIWNQPICSVFPLHTTYTISSSANMSHAVYIHAFPQMVLSA